MERGGASKSYFPEGSVSLFTFQLHNQPCHLHEVKSGIENGEQEVAEAVKSGKVDTREALVPLADPPAAAHLI